MKTYKITLLTGQGPKIEIYKHDPDALNCLENFEQEMIKKHGTFITLESVEI